MNNNAEVQKSRLNSAIFDFANQIDRLDSISDKITNKVILLQGEYEEVSPLKTNGEPEITTILSKLEILFDRFRNLNSELDDFLEHLTDIIG